jgi:hypothetical protein
MRVYYSLPLVVLKVRLLLCMLHWFEMCYMGEGRFTTLWVSRDLASGQSVVLKVRLLLCMLHRFELALY